MNRRLYLRFTLPMWMQLQYETICEPWNIWKEAKLAMYRVVNRQDAKQLRVTCQHGKA